MMGWCGWGPRTDAAECDTHFYVLVSLGNNIFTHGHGVCASVTTFKFFSGLNSKTYQNLPKPTKTYENLAWFSKPTKTYQNLPKPTKTYQNLPKPTKT
jgi:hypothetical protein